MRGKADKVPAAPSTLRRNTGGGAGEKKKGKKTGVLGQKKNRAEENESNPRSFSINQHSRPEEETPLGKLVFFSSSSSH